MAKKQLEDPPVVDEAPAVRVARNPLTTIGLEARDGIDYRGLPDPDWRYDRAITIDGVRYEHTSTDPDGVWIYRSMK